MLALPAMLFAAMALLFAPACVQAALQAARTFALTVLPSLFPLMAAARLTSRQECSDFHNLSPAREWLGMVAFGWLAGSPAAAANVSQRVAGARLSPMQAQRAMSAVGVMSPMFFLGALGERLGAPTAWRMLGSHWLAALCVLALEVCFAKGAADGRDARGEEGRTVLADDAIGTPNAIGTPVADKSAAHASVSRGTAAADSRADDGRDACTADACAEKARGACVTDERNVCAAAHTTHASDKRALHATASRNAHAVKAGGAQFADAHTSHASDKRALHATASRNAHAAKARGAQSADAHTSHASDKRALHADDAIGAPDALGARAADSRADDALAAPAADKSAARASAKQAAEAFAATAADAHAVQASNTTAAPSRPLAASLRALGAALPRAIADASVSMAAICGAMMLFAVVWAMLQALLTCALPVWCANHAGALSVGHALMEIGAGAFDVLDALSGVVPPNLPAALVCALCSFGGLSIHLQNRAVGSDAIRWGAVLLRRALHALLAFVICSAAMAL